MQTAPGEEEASTLRAGTRGFMAPEVRTMTQRRADPTVVSTID